MRTLWVVFLLALLGLLNGCPQPLEPADTGNNPAGETAAAPAAELDIAMGQPTPDDGSDPVGADGTAEFPVPAEGAGTADTVVPPDQPKSFLESLGERLTGGRIGPKPAAPGAATDQPAAPGTVAGPPTGPVQGDAVPPEPGESTAVDPAGLDDPQAALDAGRMLHDAEPASVGPAFKAPAARVSRDSVAFAGEWVTVVVNQAGRARDTAGEDEWRFHLSDDGRCRITQHVNGDIWEQTGGWEFVGSALTLNLGPGGRRTYTAVLPRDDVAILSDQTTGAVLFCLRPDAAVKAPMLLKHYDSDFGAVEFNKSGPAYWKGTYGEPAGTLLVHVLGTYLVGTWEQQPGNGFVLLELQPDGFDGWWWYAASTEFDGAWRGRAAE